MKKQIHRVNKGKLMIFHEQMMNIEIAYVYHGVVSDDIGVNVSVSGEVECGLEIASSVRPGEGEIQHRSYWTMGF